MVKNSGSMVKKTVIDLIMLFLPFALLRLGWFVQATILYEHPQAMHGLLGLRNGYFWGNFLYVGVAMFFIYVLFRQDYTGLRLLWLALPLFCFAFLSFVICLVKGIVETIKIRRKPKPEISVEE